MGTHYQGGEEGRRSLDAFIKLIRAAESVLSRVHKRTDSGLTVSQFGVLESLLHMGPMHQQLIGAKLLKSGGNITMVIDNLEKRGLVERQRDRKDRRYVHVHLTDSGRAFIEDIFPRHVESVLSEFKPLSPEDMNTLGRLCRTLGRGEE